MISLVKALVIYILINNLVRAHNPTDVLPSAGDRESASDSAFNPSKDRQTPGLCSNDSGDANFELKLKTEENGNETEDNNLKIKKSGSNYTFNFSHLTKCSNLKFNEESIWTHDPSAYGNYYPRSISYNIENKRLFVQFYQNLVRESSSAGSVNLNGRNHLYDNSTDISNIFQSSSISTFELEGDSESIGSLSVDNYLDDQDENQLINDESETCGDQDACSISYQPESGPSDQPLNPTTIYESSSIPSELYNPIDGSDNQSPSDVFL